MNDSMFRKLCHLISTGFLDNALLEPFTLHLLLLMYVPTVIYSNLM